jgi:NAD+ diphosphatase
MVGCFGRAKPNQTIRLDLDNELEGKLYKCFPADVPDAQFFSRSQVAALLGTEAGQYLSKSDLKQLDKSQVDKESEAALAPSERKEGEVEAGEKKGLTRIPPDSAIAGQLIRLWISGGVELVSKL